jgi:peptidoglycan glycosyltransferase
VYWRRRLVPLAALAGVALIGGVVIGASHRDGRLDVAERYVHAWARGDWKTMYAQLSDDAKQRVSLTSFARAHREALAIATAAQLVPGKAKADGSTVSVPVSVRTRIFGVVRTTLALPLTGDGDKAKVDWKSYLAFPGVAAGQRLTRQTQMPPRATLETRDGQVLASGAARTPAAAVADIAGQTVGTIGPIPPERATELKALGVPDGTKVGLGGLERALDQRLIGLPGGQLFAGSKLLAHAIPRQAPAVRTTIAPDLERAAVIALAGRVGGVVALDPRTGEVLAFAGIPFSSLQPPGSTFKMVTLTGALESGAAKLSDSFPVQTAATLSGVELSNANGEACGGTLANSFAQSCNSVFAPLGVKLGAQKLVATAEKYGFNAPPDIPGVAMSTLPQADQIGDDLAVGSTAIGQGEVQATTLQMAVVAATIGRRGRRPRVTVDLATARRGDAPTTQAIGSKSARIAEKLMLGVVRYGTGVSAAIANVKVAGKTGTAELQNTHDCQVATDPQASNETCVAANDPTDTDAWFAAYAPAGDGHPKIAVCVMLVRNGAGGDTAAPVARGVIVAALKRAT